MAQRRLDSSSQRIIGRIIKWLSYNETVEVDGSLSVIHAFLAGFSFNCARIPHIFAQKVCPIKDVINFSRLSD